MLILRNVLRKNAVSNKKKHFVVAVAAQCLCNSFSIVPIIFFVEGELVNDVHTWQDLFNSDVQVHKLIGSAEFVKKTNDLQCRIKTESLMFEGKLCRLTCAPCHLKAARNAFPQFC